MATSWMLSVKVASMSVGVLLTTLMLNLSLPALVEFLNYELPLLWSIAVSRLEPPYLYIVINCIILTIVASSKFQPQKSEADGSAVAPQYSFRIKAKESVRFSNQSPIKPVFDLNDASAPVGSPVVFGYVEDVEDEKVLEVRPATAEAVVGRYVEGEQEVERVDGSETEIEEFVVSRSSWMPPRNRGPVEQIVVSTNKPLVSQRFANRKSVNSSPEGGKARLGVSRPKRQDMLESTWGTITGASNAVDTSPEEVGDMGPAGSWGPV